RFSDRRITGWIRLWSDGRIEISLQKRGEIALRSATEEQALRQFTSGRKNPNIDSGILPTLECRKNIGKDLTGQSASAIPIVPDHALQHLQCGRFPILIHQPIDVLEWRVVPLRG